MNYSYYQIKRFEDFTRLIHNCLSEVEKKKMVFNCFNWITSWSGISIFLMGILIVWSLVWKVIALWKAAKKKHIIWFVLFIFLNTLGILEILYIYVFSKMKFPPKEEEKPKRRRHRTSRRKRRR